MSENNQYKPLGEGGLQKIIADLQAQLEQEKRQPGLKRARESAQVDAETIRELHRKAEQEERSRNQSQKIAERFFKDTNVFRKSTGLYALQTVSMALLTAATTFALLHTGEMTAALSDPIADVTRLADIGFTVFGFNRGKNTLGWGKLEMQRMLRRRLK